MEAIKIEPELWEEVKLPQIEKTLCIEVASEKEIDCGILDKNNLDKFYDASNDKGIGKVFWSEQVSGLVRFDIKMDNSKTYYLVIWNAYSRAKVFVSYNWFIKE